MKTLTEFRASTPAVRLHAGETALDTLGAEISRLRASRAFVICGRSVATRTGLLALVRDRLGVACAGVFDTMGKDSPWPDVQAATAAAREVGADLLVAVGGGSVIQATRVVAILLAERGDPMRMITQYPDDGPAISPRLLAPKLPIINVCTVGTSAAHRGGSAVKNDELDHRMEFFDPKTRPAVVYWDHRALATAPVSLALASGFAVWWRALLSLGSEGFNPLVEGNRRQAWALADRALPALRADPEDARPRVELCAAAWLQNRDTDDGGLTFEKHWVQRVAYAFSTALFIRHPEVAQGHAHAALTPAVLRELGDRDPGPMHAIAEALGVPGDAPHRRAADAWASRVAALGLPGRLSALGVPRAVLPQLVQDSLRNFNADPKREFAREVDRLREVIEAAW
jgi:alcohol dehydrogenase class IV